MSWSRTFTKVVALTTLGFLIPFAMLLPAELAFAEFGSQPAWRTLRERYIPPATGCSLLFLFSAITSSTPRKTVTFVQSVGLHGLTFIICYLAFVPIQHNKVADPQHVYLAWIPIIAVLFVFVLLLAIGNVGRDPKRTDLDPIADNRPEQ